MKSFILIALFLTAFTVIAQTTERYIKETKDYAGFGGREKNMREETIFKIVKGQKVKVGSKISVIEPYQVRELEIDGKYWRPSDTSTHHIREKYDSLLKLVDDTSNLDSK